MQTYFRWGLISPLPLPSGFRERYEENETVLELVEPNVVEDYVQG